MTLAPPPSPDDPTAVPGPGYRLPGHETPRLVEVRGDGFVPGEEVDVAVVLRAVEAGLDGRARALLDGAELGHSRRVILMGAISGTVVTSPVIE